MRIEGACHCRNIRFTLDWPEGAPAIMARECGCTFCRKHGGAWTSNPDAALEATLDDDSLLSRYRFGHGTADFCVCARCGVAPFVISAIDGRDYAVVNVNCFDNVDPCALARSPASFDGEDSGGRLERRARNWIASVDLRRVGD